MVEKGADIYAKNSKGKTPLDSAAPGVAPILLNPSLPIPGNSYNHYFCVSSWSYSNIKEEWPNVEI